MAITVSSGCVIGVSGIIILIEIQIFNQLNKFIIGGMADTAIQEAKERVKFAIENSGYHFTKKGIMINLVPAQMRKEGSQLDLAMAIGLLQVTKQIKLSPDKNTLFLGELGLEGVVRAVPGAIAILLHASRCGYHRAYISAENEFEASIIADQIEIFCLSTLHDIENAKMLKKQYYLSSPSEKKTTIDFQDIVGNAHAKRALIIAAAGGHNVLLTGPPGTGKSLLAKGFYGLLPALSEQELITIVIIHSVNGAFLNNTAIHLHRPFQAPHHTASANAIIGGGIIPKPGAITLAHHGVLFLDEFPEFQSDVLESLREPLEEGHITISRTRGSATFPAQFQLIAAMNPCPCGYSNDKDITCTCSKYTKQRYLQKLSGPILDRIDLFSFVPRLLKESLWHTQTERSSNDWRAKVEIAYNCQIRRQQVSNAKLPLTLANAKQLLKLAPETTQLITDLQHISARGLVRLLKVGRTIADLEEADLISAAHLTEAINFRSNWLRS